MVVWKKILAEIVFSIYTHRQTLLCRCVLDVQAFFVLSHLALLLLNSGTAFDCCS